MAKETKGLRNQVKQEKKVIDKIAKNKRIPFIRTRMWLSVLLAKFEKDRGTIPSNIADRILITNNLYITNRYLNTIIIYLRIKKWW